VKAFPGQKFRNWQYTIPSIAHPPMPVTVAGDFSFRQSQTTAMEDLLTEFESYYYKSGEDLIIWLRQQSNDLDYEAIEERLQGLLS
jgi:hypothetical protein